LKGFWRLRCFFAAFHIPRFINYNTTTLLTRKKKKEKIHQVHDVNISYKSSLEMYAKVADFKGILAEAIERHNSKRKEKLKENQL